MPITTPRGGDLRVDKPQRGGDRAVREQALARAQHKGEDPQAVLVDDPVADQRLGEVPAAVHLELRPV
ncbi:MAG TPA: hypothetical protein VMR89_09550 [Actinomycetota bacterium]|nr:hypothetical protein [Actinomycetota bacterium]